jgi:hypothetical protein
LPAVLRRSRRRPTRGTLGALKQAVSSSWLFDFCSLFVLLLRENFAFFVLL